MNPLTLFWIMLKAGMLSTSGTGNLPMIHQELTERGWAEERHFAEALAIGQISPGPSGLWVISLGYMLGGLRGSLVATAATILPTLCILLYDRVYSRIQHHPAVEGFVRGLTLAGLGIFATVMLQIAQNTGADWKSALIGVLAITLGTQKRVPIIAVLVCGGVLGVLLRSL